MIDKPASQRFDDIKIGQTANFSVTINESMLESFARLSGDYNPLHMSEAYATKSSFGKRICHGMLIASFFSRLVGMHLPGKNALYFSQTLNFQAPCFVGDIITIEGHVTDKSIATKIITIKTSAYNQTGECLVDGVAKVIVREDTE